MTEKPKSHPQLAGRAGISSTSRPGLRLIKTAPEDILTQITAGGISNAEEKKVQTLAKAKANPLVKQLSSLADALDAEVAMILKM
jgi:hypothetical protein